MHPFFEPLSDREVMLLLTTLTVGGSDQIELFQHLHQDVAARLYEKAQALLAIETEKRVPFMVNQMKQGLSHKGMRGVERVDPSWILQAMRGESPRVVAAILVTLPTQVVRSVLKRLPSAVRKNLPPRDELEAVPKELVGVVRQIFESSFHAMPATSAGNTFGFRDIIHLERVELNELMRDLGLEELGQAFAAVGRLALAELCRRLPRSKAEELIMAVRRASRLDVPDLKTAQRFLSRVVVNFNDTEEFFQKAGLWRVSKACLLESADFHAAFRQRIPRDAGNLFDKYLQKAQSLEELPQDRIERLQDAIIVRIQALSGEAVISPRWAQLKPQLHDPGFEERLVRSTAEEPESSE